MSNVDDAVELKAIARDFGLRTHDLRTPSPADTRFTVDLSDGGGVDKITVQASPTRLAISHDLTESTEPLTYDEALELMLQAIGK